MKTLILYYSKSGHTRDLAAAIHKVIGGDMSELKSQRKYSSSYGMTILQAGLDKFRGRIPETEPVSFNLNDYDVIFLGCPTWYFTMAPAMQQFLSHADLKGKHVFTFSTSGGSPKKILEDLRMAVEKRGGTMEEQLQVSYKKENRMTTQREIDQWIRKAADRLEFLK